MIFERMKEKKKKKKRKTSRSSLKQNLTSIRERDVRLGDDPVEFYSRRKVRLSEVAKKNVQICVRRILRTVIRLWNVKEISESFARTFAGGRARARARSPLKKLLTKIVCVSIRHPIHVKSVDVTIDHDKCLVIRISCC